MKTIAAFALALSATTLLAQPKPVEVKVHQVNDRRTNGSFSRLTLDLVLPKIRSADVEASRVLLTAATDDSDKRLIEPEATIRVTGEAIVEALDSLANLPPDEVRRQRREKYLAIGRRL